VKFINITSLTVHTMSAPQNATSRRYLQPHAEFSNLFKHLLMAAISLTQSVLEHTCPHLPSGPSSRAVPPTSLQVSSSITRTYARPVRLPSHYYVHSTPLYLPRPYSDYDHLSYLCRCLAAVHFVSLHHYLLVHLNDTKIHAYPPLFQTSRRLGHAPRYVYLRFCA